MQIKTKKQYNKIPNGAMLTVFLVGDEWEDNIGDSDIVIKVDNELRLLNERAGRYYFNEKDDPGYEFVVAYQKDSYKGDE